MKLGDWNARIVENHMLMQYDLYLWRDTGHGREAITHKGTIVQVKEGTVSKDLHFARFENVEQLQALAEAFSSFGVKTTSDHKNEGLLEATKAHLDDMRTLVFSKAKR